MTLFGCNCKYYILIGVMFSSIVDVMGEEINAGPRGKRGAAYAGGHPGGGYGVGGVGIPGLNSAAEYSAYNQLLRANSHGGSSGYGGGGGSSHGRKLTVDQAIGMFGHHTLNRPYPYTAEHGGNSSGGHGRRGASSGSGGYSSGGASNSYGR